MARIRSTLTLITASFGFVLFSGCGQITRNSEFEVDNASARQRQGAYEFQSLDAMRAGGAQISESFYVAPVDERVRAEQLLPANLRQVNAVSIVSREPMGLAAIAARLSRITGVPHIVALGPTGSRVSSEFDGGTDSPAPRVDENGNPIEATESTTTSISASGASTRAGTLRIRPNLTGSLGKVLNGISDAFEVEWSVEDGRVVFRDYITRQYQMSALPVTSAYDGSNSSGSLDIWSEIESTLENLTGEGTRITIGQGTGIITVTALMSDQARIEDYLRTMNTSMGQQIAFDVNVLNVTLDETEGFAFNLSQVILNATGNPAALINYTTEAAAGATQTPIGTVNVGIVGNDFSLDSTVAALSARNKVAVENRTGATTTNFQSVPIAVTQSQAYVSGVGSQEVGSGFNSSATETTVQTSEVVTGFEMVLLPRMLNTREILLRYDLSLSDLLALETFTASTGGTRGTTFVQLPEVSEISIEQQAILKNGQTLVLAGFERNRADLSAEGIGDPKFFGLGGGRGARIERVASIVFITPRLLTRVSSR